MLARKRINEVYCELAALKRAEVCKGLPNFDKIECTEKVWHTLQVMLFYAFLNDAGIEVSYKNLEYFLHHTALPKLSQPDSLQEVITMSLDMLLLTYIITNGVTFSDITSANEYYTNCDIVFFEKSMDQVEEDIVNIANQYNGLDQQQQIELFLKRCQPILSYAKQFGFD